MATNLVSYLGYYFFCQTDSTFPAALSIWLYRSNSFRLGGHGGGFGQAYWTLNLQH